MKSKKKIGLIVFSTLLFAIAITGYLTFGNAYENYLLTREVNKLTELDLTKDRYDTEYVTTGQFKIVEKAIKDYLQEYATNVQNINSLISDDKFTSLLSYQNLSTDSSFANSILFVNDTMNEFNLEMDKLVKLASRDNIRNNIAKFKLDDYYVDMYYKLMFDDNMQRIFNISTNNLESYRENINNKFKACNEIFFFLNVNTDKYAFEDGELHFYSDSMMNQYNSYIKKIKA